MWDRVHYSCLFSFLSVCLFLCVERVALYNLGWSQTLQLSVFLLQPSKTWNCSCVAGHLTSLYLVTWDVLI